jgi:hypothetical protein
VESMVELLLGFEGDRALFKRGGAEFCNKPLSEGLFKVGIRTNAVIFPKCHVSSRRHSTTHANDQVHVVSVESTPTN